MNEVACWERKFQVWQYSVSHSTLLLRSVVSGPLRSRIDIAFPAVEIMKLQPTYRTLRIDVVAQDEVAEWLGVHPGISHGSLFLLNGGEGYVWSADFQWFEDEGDQRSPSRFGPLRGTA